MATVRNNAGVRFPAPIKAPTQKPVHQQPLVKVEPPPSKGWGPKPAVKQTSTTGTPPQNHGWSAKKVAISGNANATLNKLVSETRVQTAAPDSSTTRNVNEAAIVINGKNAGRWRGGPDTPVGKVVAAMMDRLAQSAKKGTKIDFDTPTSLFVRGILDNRSVTNEQLIAMSKVKLSQIATSAEGKADLQKRVPNARELPVHKFTVEMMAAATGLDARAISEACPDLGLTGAVGTSVLFASDTPRVQKSTALHDFTSTMHDAGIAGVNSAVWGVDDVVASAGVSIIGAGDY